MSKISIYPGVRIHKVDPASPPDAWFAGSHFERTWKNLPVGSLLEIKSVGSNALYGGQFVAIEPVPSRGRQVILPPSWLTTAHFHQTDAPGGPLFMKPAYSA